MAIGTNVGGWFTTAASNATTTGITWAEGQLPSTVNDSARQLMADLRSWYNDAGWIQYGDTDGQAAIIYNSASSIKVNGIDVTGAFHAGRRIRVVAASPGTIYGTISSSSFSTDTTVNITFDSGSLSNETPTTVAISTATFTNTNIPAVSGAMPRSYLAGLGMANGTDATNDIDIAAGAARDSANAADMVLAATLTKQLDAAWAVGTNAGGLDTGSIANTTYHIWLIKRPDTGVVDALFSASASAPTMPTNYTLKRRIGSIVRSGATIKAFKQWGDLFRLSTAVQDISAANPGASAVTRTLASVPTGVIVHALLNVIVSSTAGDNVYLSDLAVSDQAPSSSAAPGYTAGTAVSGNLGGQYEVLTNTSAQIRSRNVNGAAADTLYINTLGWTDRRGRDD